MPEQVRLALVLVPFGLFTGLVGSLTGVGGGFLVVPFLILAGPAVLGRPFTPEEATGTSLAVVLVNAAAASTAAARRKRIDYGTALLFAASTLPGAYGGRILVRMIRPDVFGIVFGCLLLLVAIYLVASPPRAGRPLLRGWPREVTEVAGEANRFEVNRAAGVVVSFLVGFLSSMLGVGGGIIHSPFLILVCGAPTHIATATSQFALCFTSAVGATEAAFRGKVDVRVLFWMGLGVIAGGQLGIHLAKRVPSNMVRWILAAVYVATAGSMAWRFLLAPGRL